MKKLLALALAVMLLMASAAFAESANVTTLSNFNLLLTNDQGTQLVDLSDATVEVAMGSPRGVPTIQVDVQGGGQALLGAEIQFINGYMVLNIDGMSRPLAASMQMSQAQEGIEKLFANMDSVSEFKLPAFKGVDIPKLNLTSVASMLPMLGITPQTSGQTTTFEIPAQYVSLILQTLVTQIPAEFKARLGGLDQMLANAQFGISGKISDDGATSELLLDLVPAQGGAQIVPMASLYLASSANSDSFEIIVYQNGSPITLGKLDLVSDPAAATVDFAMNLMGQVALNVSLYPQDGAQVVAMELKAQEQEMKASLTYGEEGNQEYAQLALEIPNQSVAASADVVEAPAAGGGKEGTVAVNIASGSQSVILNADLFENKDDVVFRTIDNADRAYDANRMTEADNRALAADLQNALAGLMGYLNSIQVQPAA